MKKVEDCGSVTDVVDAFAFSKSDCFVCSTVRIPSKTPADYCQFRTITFFFFLQTIEEQYLNNKWFQKDGATSHTTQPVMGFLCEKFSGHVSSGFGNVSWPSRSCDLTSLDFFPVLLRKSLGSCQ